MNDMAAVTGQLARLRESLQQKQQELDGMASFSDAERTRSIQFIGKLMQTCRGHDRELDNRLAKLKQKLEGNPPLTSIDADLIAIEKLLQQHSHTMEESISLTRAAIDLGSKQLKTIKGFPEDTRRALKEFRQPGELRHRRSPEEGDPAAGVLPAGDQDPAAAAQAADPLRRRSPPSSPARPYRLL